MPVTLNTLIPLLQARLNDASDGQWSLEDKKRFLNSARKRTVAAARCYATTVSKPVVVGTATYEVDPLFEPLAVRFGDVLLEKVKLASMPIITQNWDAYPAGSPAQWTPLYGSTVRVHPAPDAGAASMIGAVAAAPGDGGSGYAVGDLLTVVESGASGGEVEVAAVAAGVVTALRLRQNADGTFARGSGYTTGPDKATTGGSGSGCTVWITALAALEVYGYAGVDNLATDETPIVELPPKQAEEALLLAAEEEARRARPSMAGSLELAALLHNLWLEQVRDIRTAVGWAP